MKRSRLVTWTPLLLLAGLGALTTWLNRTVQSGAPRAGVDLTSPDVKVEDLVAIKYNPDGTRRYHLTAKRFEHRADEDSTQLIDPVLTQYHPDDTEMSVRSHHAWVSQDANEVIFTGDVLIERGADAQSGPVRLSTSFLKVYPDDGIARTDKEVVITGDNGTLRGVGLEFNNHTRQMRLESRVRGQFKNPRAP